MENLSSFVIDYLKKEGAVAAGIATIETLAGGPPSTDLTYVMPNAKSAVCFAVPLNQSYIEPFLAKKDRRSHEKDNLGTNVFVNGIAFELAKHLETKGIPSVPIASNEVYRTDTPLGMIDMMPDISLRYLAAASGVGHFGLSGNIIHKDYGAAIILGAVVTSAEITPTKPLPLEDKYCDQCKLCMASCSSGLMAYEEEHVRLGGVEFTYSKRKNYMRCEFVCGGFTGLYPSGKWSTWSPGRFPIPETDEEFRNALIKGIQAYSKWPTIEGGHHHILMQNPLYITCGNCGLICHPDKEVRKRRFRMLTESGVVIQNPDGSLHPVSPAEAKKRITEMDAETRALYE
jgi:epoxyqueuosine reductase QueG